MYNYFLHLRTYLIIKRKQWLEHIQDEKKNYTYTPFIILCEPRSGSTLLHTYLNFHPNILSYGEILREIFEYTKAEGAQDDILQKCIFKPHSRNLKAVGLKLFYEYYNQQPYARSFQELVARTDVKVIHLIRKDPLKLYASLKIAQQTNVWSSGEPTSPKQKIRIDTAAFSQFLKKNEEHYNLFNSMFQKHAMLEITYEDLNAQPQQTLGRVQQFLHVKPRRLYTLLKKQNPEAFDTLITNYEDLIKLIPRLKT